MEANDGSVTTIENNGNKLTVCDLSAVKDTIEVPLSEFVEDCRIVRFETSEEAYFKAWFINATDKHIGIRQGNQDVFKLFDRDGKFLYNVGSVGSGPVNMTPPSTMNALMRRTAISSSHLLWGKES